MITDLDVIQAISDLYNERPVFDHIVFNPLRTMGVYVGIKYVAGHTLVIYRGSTTAQDWAKDFFAVPHECLDHPQLGALHAGFAFGADHAYAEIKPLIKGPVVVGGHSLGAAQALIGTALMLIDNVSIIASVVFGEPKPGMERLKELLAPVTIRSYKNCDDLVTHVPFTLLGLNYQHPRELLALHEPPLPNDPWRQLGAHHHELYLAAIGKMKDIPVIVQ